MKKFAFLALFAAAAFTFSSCASATQPVTGFLFSDVKGPMTVTSNTAGKKVGKATATSIVGLIAQGDASIEAAAKSAGITKISHVDYHSTNILGVYATFTVTVYGD